MTRSVDGVAPAPPLHRFARSERLVHRTFAVLMLTCIATAAILYNGFLAAPIGNRRIVKQIHVWSGYALPFPVVLGLLSSAVRDDLGRLNRFAARDWTWLRSRDRRSGRIAVGKFNAGQKLNTALTGGAVVVLLASGTVMNFPDLTRLAWRTGATFVHDWFALALGLLVIGHIRFAARDPISREGMRRGSVPVSWARRHHRAWADEMTNAARPGTDLPPG